MERKLKKGGFISALKLIDNAKAGKVAVKTKAFDSGSEGSRRGNSPDQEENQYGGNETDSEFVPVEHDETINRTILEEQKIDESVIMARRSKISKPNSSKRDTGINESIILGIGNQETQFVNESMLRAIETSNVDFLEEETEHIYSWE